MTFEKVLAGVKNFIGIVQFVAEGIGESHKQKKEASRTIERCTILLQLDSTVIDHYIQRGKCFLIIEQSEAALRDFEEVLNLRKGAPRTYDYDDLAEAHTRLGQFHKAIEAMNAANALDPTSRAGRLYKMSNCYEKLGENEEAINYLSEYIDTGAGSIFYRLRAELYRKLGIDERAAADEAKYLQLSAEEAKTQKWESVSARRQTKQPDWWASSALFYESQEKAAADIEKYSMALKSMPADTELIWRRALAYAAIQASDDLFADLKVVLKEYPQYEPAYTLWATSLIKADKLDDSVAVLSEGLKHLSDSKTLRALLAKTYARLGDEKQAESEFQLVIALAEKSEASGETISWRDTRYVEYYGGFLERQGNFQQAEKLKSSVRGAETKQTRYWLISDEGSVLALPDYIGSCFGFSEGLACAKNTKGFGQGYIDKDGHWCITPQFASAGWFHEGLATFSFDHEIGLQKMGFIDTAGGIVVPARYESAWSFREGLAPYRVGSHTAGLMGFIDRAGEEVVRPLYNDTGPFSQERAWVRLVDRFGYIDNAGKVVIPIKFDGAKNFNQGYAAVKLGSTWSYIDRDGNPLKTIAFEEVNSFSDDVATVKVDGKWGAIDNTGEIIVPPQFSRMMQFYGGVSLAWMEGKVGVINKRGCFLSDLRFDGAEQFSNGLARVTRAGETGFLSSSGEMLIEPQFDECFDFVGSLAAARRYNYWGFINMQGEWVVPPQFNQVQSSSQSEIAIGVSTNSFEKTALP